MKELDLLKKDWQKNSNAFEQVSENEIYKMIHRRSSSIVKWILIISILEFVLLNALGLVLPDNTQFEGIGIEFFIKVLTYISYGLPFVFMFFFYKNYQSISATATTKKLMQNILTTRKTVRYYIYSNLGIGFLFGIITGFYLIRKSVVEQHKSVAFLCMELFLFLVILILVLAILWLFYRLLYGYLLKKLQKNYEELKKIDL
jgi:hypothetical protein